MHGVDGLGLRFTGFEYCDREEEREFVSDEQRSRSRYSVPFPGKISIFFWERRQLG